MPLPLPGVPAEDLAHTLAHTGSLWDGVRGSTLFLTGGTGFVGSWLLESFRHANRALALQARCVVLTRNPAAFAAISPHLAADESIELLPGDVRDFAFPQGNVRFVIHAAADTAPGAPDPAGSHGTLRTLELARACGAQRFLFLSSGAVYGPQPPDLESIGEDAAPAPAIGPYAAGKRAAESLCADFSARHQLHCTVARLFTFAGPRLPGDGQYAFSSFLRSALNGDPIRLTGDGSPVRTYLHAADMAVWLWTILLRGAAATAYNVGSEVPVTIGALAAEIARQLAPGLPVTPGPPGVTGRGSSRYVPSTLRARSELGLREWIGWQESILRTARWMQHTPEAVAQ